MKKIIIAAIALITLVACAKDNEPIVDVASDVAAKFVSSAIMTRTSDSDWETDDQIGIYMYKSGERDNSYLLAKENVLHTSDVLGNFTISGDEVAIYYPQTDLVDFYAYYPYQAGIDTIYTANIAAQNLADGSFDQGAVDFVTASLLQKSKSDETLSFEFDHRLAMVTFVITPKSSISTLRDVEVSLGEINTQATFSTLTGDIIASSGVMGSVAFATIESEVDGSDNVTKLTATAMLLPETISSQAKITFKVSDALSHTASFPSTTTFEAGKNHTYNISVGNDGVNFPSASIVTGWSDNSLISSDTLDAEED